MPIFTAIATAVTGFATAIGFSAATAATIGAIGAFAARTLVTIGISRLIANRATNKTGAGAQDAGARIQLAPATNNKLPVVYGSAFVAPTITDAKISTDQKTMWYVCALSEKTTGTFTFGNIYYDGKLVTFDGTDPAKVIKLTTNSDPVQEDTAIVGNLYMYLFTNGSSSGVNTGGQTAIQILQDSDIPVNQRWTSTDTMTNTVFMIVKVKYNRDADTVNLGQLSVQLTNTKTKPGDVLLDYMQDTVYGCAIPSSQIDTASLTALNTYSDETITYVPVGGGSATQARYRINGPVNTGDNCLSNLQQLADSCDSWLQYSELTGKWKVVINKPYTGTLNDLYHVNSDVLIGGIDINPLDLNQTYNSLEVQYPDANIKDQTNYKVVDMTDPTTAWYDPTLLSPNEPDNRIVVQYPQVNNYIQAVYLGVRRLLQSREDLTISCNLDYSGIQIEAGDVVRVTLAEYGWTDKLFRVSQVQETKTADGFLGSRITAFEYNSTIYSDNAIQDYVPADNTGLPNPNIFDTPPAPTVANGPIENGSINYFTVTTQVPTSGSTLYMDFNVGNSNNVNTHLSYTSVAIGNGTPYTQGSTVSISVADLNPATYYWSATARNDQAGKQSASSNAFIWVGPSVANYAYIDFNCVYSNGNVITIANTDSTANVRVGMNVIKTGGTGTLAANTKVTAITSGTTFIINPTPVVALNCANIRVYGGGIDYDNMNPNVNITTTLGGYSYTTAIANTVTMPINITSIGNISTGNFDASKYMTVSYTGGGGTYPFYAGTSNVADGYTLNSTSPFNPGLAAQLFLYNGDLNWYVLDYVYVGANAVSTQEELNILTTHQIVANANSLIQLLPFVSISGNANGIYADTQILHTVDLYTGEPEIIDLELTIQGTNSISGGGVLIRNFNSANVIIPNGTISLTKGKRRQI